MMKIIDEIFGNNTLYPQNEKNCKTKLNIGIANVLNGTFISFNDNFKTKDLLHALKASVSYPGIFTPHKAWNSLWFSGSSIWNNDVAAPVLRCKAMGFKEEDIILDVIVDNDPSIEVIDASEYTAIQMGWRSIELVDYFAAKDGILKAQKAYPKVQFRNVVGPKAAWTTFDFNHQFRKITQWVPIVSKI
jgi:predicted acylesterase/phospholipase RssA